MLSPEPRGSARADSPPSNGTRFSYGRSTETGNALAGRSRWARARGYEFVTLSPGLRPVL